mmetsp:Transcript_91703/g.191700  ORF Transcript_91703/g.191700 Transcript_91703/m.191700 type:complete len:120 (+) Transcript_91703:2327-2686(+)
MGDPGLPIVYPEASESPNLFLLTAMIAASLAPGPFAARRSEVYGSRAESRPAEEEAEGVGGLLPVSANNLDRGTLLALSSCGTSMLQSALSAPRVSPSGCHGRELDTEGPSTLTVGNGS